MPALFALLQWVNRHDPPPYPPAVLLEECAKPSRSRHTARAGHLVEAEDIEVTASGPFGVKNPISLQCGDG